MAEYIKKNDIVLNYRGLAKINPYDFVGIAKYFAEQINEMPAADVAPVRHGKWERTADGAALCTACKRKMNPSQYGYAFCSLCGAKMGDE